MAVGSVLEILRRVFAGHCDVELPEIVDFAEARTGIGDEALYVDASELHRLDERRILRYDLTLPLLMNVKYDGAPLRILTAGKAYRQGRIDATHLEAFHQAEVFCLDERTRLDRWELSGQVLRSVDVLFPGRAARVSRRYSQGREGEGCVNRAVKIVRLKSEE